MSDDRIDAVTRRYVELVGKMIAGGCDIDETLELDRLQKSIDPDCVLKKWLAPIAQNHLVNRLSDKFPEAVTRSECDARVAEERSRCAELVRSKVGSVGFRTGEIIIFDDKLEQIAREIEGEDKR